jgi:hypothetical protein
MIYFTYVPINLFVCLPSIVVASNMRISLQVCSICTIIYCFLPKGGAFISPITNGKHQFNLLNTHHHSLRLAPSLVSSSSDEGNERQLSGAANLFHEILALSLFGFVVTFCPMVKVYDPMYSVLASQADGSPVSVIQSKNGEEKVNTGESLLTAPSKEGKADITVVEEVWTLINKYFIDQTFNGQVSV